jgi:hypothetical protein
VLLIAFPLVLFLFLGLQARYFGRWFLPAYPALAILAGYAVVRAADRLPLRGRWRQAALAGMVAALVVQGLASSVRVSAVLAKPDARTVARDAITNRVPAGSRIVVEPFLPTGFFSVSGRTGESLYEPLPVRRPFQDYEFRLRPELIDRYRREGYCWVVVGSYQKERGLKGGLRGAGAYYRRLDAESAQTFVISPYRAGAKPVEFNFDLSFNFLPRAYLRPGPVVELHRLSGCRAR